MSGGGCVNTTPLLVSLAQAGAFGSGAGRPVVDVDPLVCTPSRNG